MSGYITQGEIGNTLAEAEGTAQVPATTGEVLGAVFQQTFAENPATRLTRFIQRRTEAYPITLQPEEANERYGVPGRLSFTEPVSVTTARQLHDFHRNSAIREDIIARRQGGIGTGMAARFGVGLAASVLDPLNVASAFVPFLGEARVAAMLGAAAGRTAASRALVRSIEGAGQGFTGALALEPLNYWLSQQDQDDYTMGDALVNLAFGTALGGALHPGLGAIRDRRALPAWSPQQHEAAVRQSTVALAEGRPVQAAAAMEFTAIRSARQEMRDWYQSMSRANDEMRAAEAQADAQAGRMGEAAANMNRLRAQLAEVRGERRGVADSTAELGLGPGERRRLREMEARIADPSTPLGERLTLELSRLDLLEQGAEAGPRGYAELDAARDEAQDRGLARVEGRLRSQLALAEARFRQAADRVLEADRVRDHRRIVQASRERTVLELGEATIRRAAGRMGVQLEPGEALALASKFLRAGPEASQRVLDDILSDLSKRAPAGPYTPDQVYTVSNAAQTMARLDTALAAREAQAERAVVDAARGTDDPRDVAAMREAEALAETAPKVEGTTEAEIAEATKATQELADLLRAADKQFAEAEVAAGREAPQPDPDLAAADELAKEGEALGRAYEAAAVCGLRRA